MQYKINANFYYFSSKKQFTHNNIFLQEANEKDGTIDFYAFSYCAYSK